MRGERERGLRFGSPVPAGDLEPGQIVVVDGTIAAVDSDPDDPDTVRLRIVRLLAGVADETDEADVILSVPRDMRIATAVPLDRGQSISSRPDA
jgi:hypothetical protein